MLSAGEVMLHVFELPGYDPTINGFSPAMFERGRLDHLGFTVAGVGELHTLRDRLVAVISDRVTFNRPEQRLATLTPNRVGG